MCKKFILGEPTIKFYDAKIGEEILPMSKILSREEINKLIDKMFDEQLVCNYCCYSSGCDGAIRSDGGGNPIYPPCCDNDMKNGEIDVYQYLEDVELEDED